MRLLITASLVALPVAALAQGGVEWEDQPMTAQETEQVTAALTAAGCTDPTSIERDDDGYEADNARCENGVFDIDLDREFRIIDRDRED